MNRNTTKTELSEHDALRVTSSCVASGHNLHKGQIGAVVGKYPGGKAYAVEFIGRDENCFVDTVPANNIERA